MLTSTENGLCSSWIVDPFCQACCLSSRHEFHMFLNKIRNRGKTIYRNSAKASESQRSNGRGKVSWRKHTGRQDSGVDIWRPTSPPTTGFVFSWVLRVCVMKGYRHYCSLFQDLLFSRCFFRFVVHSSGLNYIFDDLLCGFARKKGYKEGEANSQYEDYCRWDDH